MLPSLFWRGRTSIASIPLWELSSLPKHSDEWRVYNGGLICVPWRIQHARTPSCSKHWYSVIMQTMNASITPSHLSGRLTTVKHIFLQNKDIYFEPFSLFYPTEWQLSGRSTSFLFLTSYTYFNDALLCSRHRFFSIIVCTTCFFSFY